jgi:hypothetical protein
MELKVTGRVVEVLQEQSGESKNGTWRKRDFVIETQDNYPKKICMVQWGDEIDNSAVSVGDQITASIDIASREYNGRWYTDIKAWKVEKDGSAQPAKIEDDDLNVPGPLDDDDLPF